MNSVAVAETFQKTEGLDLAQCMVVLVKFSFTNPRHIPAGIHESSRTKDEVIDANHAAMARKDGEAHLAPVGRVRSGRVDTGEPVCQDLQKVQPAMLRRGLTNIGFQLENAHWFLQKRPGRTDKYVVVLFFSRPVIVEGAVRPEISPETTEALRALAKTTWACHVWDNVDRDRTGWRLGTINFVGRQPDVAPERALVIRHGILKTIEVSQPVEESGE